MRPYSDLCNYLSMKRILLLWWDRGNSLQEGIPENRPGTESVGIPVFTMAQMTVGSMRPALRWPLMGGVVCSEVGSRYGRCPYVCVTPRT